MTFEETKTMLDELKYKKRLVKKVQNQIQEAREQMDCLSAVDYSKVKVNGGSSEGPAERFVEHIERLEKRYEKLLQEVFDAEDYISEHMESLTAIEQSIIIDRYMSGKSWRKIQQEYHYEDRQPYNILKKAIEKLSKAERLQ